MKSWWKCLVKLLKQVYQWKSQYLEQLRYTPLPLHEPTKDFTTHESKQPKVVAAPEGSPQKLSTETTVASPHVPTTSVSAQVSSAKKELVQLLEKCQGSKRFLELQWIHFINSGGTASVPLKSFLHLLETPQPPSSLWKLSERLDEYPVIVYYDRRGQLCGKPHRHALSNDQMLRCCIQTIHSQPSTNWEGKHSKTLVVGTHKDLESTCSEIQADKSKKLVDMLTPSLQDQVVFYSPFSEVIFPSKCQGSRETRWPSVCIDMWSSWGWE